MAGTQSAETLLIPLAAAHRLGITSELLFQYTKPSFAKASGFRTLTSVEQSGKTLFSISELDAFNALLAGPWRPAGAQRPAIPKAVLDHLRAESLNQCARCGSGIGVDTAHIRSWADSRSHHHANLIRLCSQCHREHDAQHSLSTDELISLKTVLVERTRANLTARMQPSQPLGNLPRPASSFTGRDSELVMLMDALRSGRSAIITGVGGIGKTELLVQALSRSEMGRPVFWIDVEQYRDTSDILAVLRAALGKDGVACPETALPARLDAVQGCVVFDGIERATLSDIDEFEDAVAALYSATSTAQFVATSQVMLHKLPADPRIKVGKLDKQSSKQLLRGLSSDGEPAELGGLLEFCDGHALTLKLASALVDHYGSPSSALGAIEAKGVAVVSLPGRRRQSRGTSLELCLQIAYTALSIEGRQLLWAIAESPAGLFTHYLEGDWLSLAEPIEALAELRRWHLIDIVSPDERPSRTHVLSPIRAFAIESARRDDRARYETVLDRLVHGHGMMVAVLEVKYDDPNQTPYVLHRFGEELPNLLHALELARDHQGNKEMVLTAVSIVRSLMRYFFVLRLSEQGARVMHDAAELALSGGYLERASGLILQTVALAQRADRTDLAKAGLALADRLERLTEDGETLADVAMCRGIEARENGDYATAESYARKALEGYQTRLRGPNEQRSSDRVGDGSDGFHQKELHNDISNALGLLGFSLESLGRFEEAARAYQRSLRHGRGASVAVNRGQTLHQLGNCGSHLGQFREAAKHYLDAAKIFHFVGMEEYLSNALGELGYTLLDADIENQLGDVETQLIEQGLIDLAKDTKRVFDPGRPLDHNQCIRIIRKLFGSIVLISLIGKGQLLGDFCLMMGDDVLVVVGTQLSNGKRDPDEAFPLSMIETALRLGLLVSEAEETLAQYGDISRDTIGEMLRTVCNAHGWAQDIMRVVDWFAALLTRRWGYQGASPERLQEFIKNYNDDIVDYFDLVRPGEPG